MFGHVWACWMCQKYEFTKIYQCKLFILIICKTWPSIIKNCWAVQEKRTKIWFSHAKWRKYEKKYIFGKWPYVLFYEWLWLYLYAKSRESLIKQVLSKTVERLKRKEQKSDFPALNAAIGRNKHFQKITICAI